MALVTYIPLGLYALLVALQAPEAIAEVFTSGVAAFAGYFATMVTMFGWPLVIIAAL